MTGAEAVAQVLQGLGWRSDKTTEVLAALNFAQDQRETPGRTLPIFLRTTASVVATVSSQEIPVSSAFIKEVEGFEGQLRFQRTATSRTFFLEKTTRVKAEKYFYGDWRSTFDSQTENDTVMSGIPRAYVLYSNVIRIYPVPDQTYTNLSWEFFAHDTDITNNSNTNNWLTFHPWVIIGDAGWKMAADLQNQAAMQKFATIGASASKTLIDSIVERELAGRRISMGSKL